MGPKIAVRAPTGPAGRVARYVPLSLNPLARGSWASNDVRLLWLLLVGVMAGTTIVMILGGRQLLADTTIGDLRGRIDALHRQVSAWQAAHDHQVSLLDRRMRDVETAAARAEEEARIVSVQMADLTSSLVRRLEQVEQRNEIERLANQERVFDLDLDSGY
jgi:Tfp pilus assembly protein PilN